MARYTYHYEGVDGSYRGQLLFAHAWEALTRAVHDLHGERAAPVCVLKDDHPLYDRDLIARVFAACAPELAANPWQLPTALQRLAAREAAAHGGVIEGAADGGVGE